MALPPLELRRLRHRLKVEGGRIAGLLLRGAEHLGGPPASRLADLPSAGARSGAARFSALREPERLPTPRILFRPPADPLSERYAGQIAKGVHGADSTDLRAGILSLDDASVLMPWGLHRWQGRIFRNAVLNPRMFQNPKYAFLLESMPFRRSRRAEEGVLLSLPFFHNYYHWLLEILPRLELVQGEPALADAPLLVPRESPSYVRESLSLAARGQQIEALEDGLWRFRTLHIPTRLSVASRVSPRAVAWVRERFLPAGHARPWRRIHVSRRDARARFAANEDEVEAILAKFGFETVCPGELPLVDQAQLFAESEFVVGSHGAAFANLAFAPRGATFVEFFEEGHFNPAFLHLAAVRGLRYGLLVGTRAGLGTRIEPSVLRDLIEHATEMRPPSRTYLTP